LDIPTRRPLTFGICRNPTLPYPELVRQFRLYERLGFETAWLTDHFQRPSGPGEPYLEGWTTLAAIIPQTSRIRVGVLVTSNTFRSPALLAKMTITLDQISGGRLEVGLGAGWYEREHEQFGIAFPPPAERVARFAEAAAVVDLLLRDAGGSFDGRYYQLVDAALVPGSVQRPRPPLTMGAHGPKMLATVARYADRWNSFGTVEEIRERNAMLDDACARIGRDPGEIVRSFFGQVPRDTMANRLEFDPWDSPDAFAHMVGIYGAAGTTDFIVDGPEPHQERTMEQIATDLLPGLRTHR
jgi:alkanesulfonate monooxygenase SsuD/methylene tetrahydromethanopterin reductase-like flavin-dependent oxidoreductase (luciferase family)